MNDNDDDLPKDFSILKSLSTVFYEGTRREKGKSRLISENYSNWQDVRILERFGYVTLTKVGVTAGNIPRYSVSLTETGVMLLPSLRLLKKL